MIPPFTKNGLLPIGVHNTTWEIFCERYGVGPKRIEILEQLRTVLQIFKGVGCQRIYIDGSFVTSKRRPSDFDLCWEEEGVDKKLLNEKAPLLKNPNTFRGENCRMKYGGDVYKTNRRVKYPPDSISFLEFFQLDKKTKEGKGIILLELQKIEL